MDGDWTMLKLLCSYWLSESKNSVDMNHGLSVTLWHGQTITQSYKSYCKKRYTFFKPYYFELEYSIWNQDRRSFDGPYFYWSYPMGFSGSGRDKNIYAFWWDQFNLKDHSCIHINNMIYFQYHIQ